jgi:hypothetical protein
MQAYQIDSVLKFEDTSTSNCHFETRQSNQIVKRSLVLSNATGTGPM